MSDPTCRYCGADCSNGRSWDGGNLYACPPCSDARAERNALVAGRAERWSIRVEFEDEPDVETAVGQSATSAANAIMGLLNDRDLWPDRVEVQRLGLGADR